MTERIINETRKMFDECYDTDFDTELSSLIDENVNIEHLEHEFNNNFTLNKNNCVLMEADYQKEI